MNVTCLFSFVIYIVTLVCVVYTYIYYLFSFQGGVILYFYDYMYIMFYKVCFYTMSNFIN